MLSNKDVRAMYGRNAVISRKGAFILVHLDFPSPDLMMERTREFDPEEYFCIDCPLCQLIKGSGIVVFDDSVFDEDSDLEE
jgi:hypothetical protein